MSIPATTPTPVALILNLKGLLLDTPVNSFRSAFVNPCKLDIIQVVNPGGQAVWNLTYLGISNFNPTTWTKTAGGVSICLLDQFFALSFALAFKNVSQLDILQVVGPGNVMIGHTNYLGVNYLP